MGGEGAEGELGVLRSGRWDNAGGGCGILQFLSLIHGAHVHFVLSWRLLLYELVSEHLRFFVICVLRFCVGVLRSVSETHNELAGV